jgi:hypothetical protein
VSGKSRCTTTYPEFDGRAPAGFRVRCGRAAWSRDSPTAGDQAEPTPGRARSSILGPAEFFSFAGEAKSRAREVPRIARKAPASPELFNEAKNKNTHIIVERIVADIDDIVKKVRFPDWQRTSQGERLVQKSLHDVLYLKYKIKDQELFDKAYGYIREYY